MPPMTPRFGKSKAEAEVEDVAQRMYTLAKEHLGKQAIRMPSPTSQLVSEG